MTISSENLPAIFVTFVLIYPCINEQIDKVKLQVQLLNELDMKRAMAGPSKSVDLDIPESVGLLTPQPMRSSARLMDVDIGRLGKRRL